MEGAFMALNSIRYNVRLMIAQTNEAIRDANTLHDTGTDFEKVVAAGELDFLHRQKAMQQSRLGQIERVIAAHGRRLSWLRQTWFDLVLSFENWIAHA
jgi:hypothetical protein